MNSVNDLNDCICYIVVYSIIGYFKKNCKCFVFCFVFCKFKVLLCNV